MARAKGKLMLNGNIIASDIDFTYEISEAGVDIEQCYGDFELDPSEGMHIRPGKYLLVRSDGKQSEINIQNVSHSSGDLEFEFQCNTPFE
mgnify:CR=1 FL=1